MDIEGIQEQMAQVTEKYPDALLLCKKDAEIKYGGFTVLYTTELPKGRFNLSRTWVAFDAPPGFPAAHPQNFYTHPDLRMSYGGFIRRSSYQVHPLLGATKRKWETFEVNYALNAQCIHGQVHLWNPNHSSLFTYAMVIKHALIYQLR